MRLKLQRSGPENTKSAKMEPLTEGIIPSQRRPYGFFTRMSDEELVGYANEVIKERRIKWKGELLEADNGLYLALKRRMLLDEVDVESSNKNDRDWTAKSDEKLVTFAKRFIAKRGIRKRSGLEKADGGLFGVLKKRKLLDEIGLPAGNGGYREWAGMGTDELVAHAKRLITDKGITGRGELSKMDGGIYWVLRRRKLLDKIGLMDLRGEPRDWAKRNDAQLVADAKGFISVKGITGRKELEKVDCGLYAALRKRELLDDIGLEKKIRGWAGMDNEELVAHAKELIAERGIKWKKELRKADQGLYSVLLLRKLLDAAFSDAESSKQAEAVDGVIDALGSFGDGK